MLRFNLGLARRRLLVLTAVAVLTWGAAGSVAGNSVEQAEAAVERLVRQIIELLRAGHVNDGQGLARLGEIVDREADLDRLGRLVLGQHWRGANEQQRSEYRTLFRDLMLRKFAGHLGAYANGTVEDETFRITGSQRVGDSDILVESMAAGPERRPIEIAWRLRGQDDSPLVIDVIVEGVSLLISQRSEFSSVIAQNGMDGLLAELRARLEREQARS